MQIIKSFFLFVWEIFKIVVMALAIVIPIRYYLFQPFFVKGQSMEPSFANGDYLIIDELSYRVSEPNRGDVIVFKYPNNPSQRYIKRIIGLPGEKIEIRANTVIVSTEEGNQALNEETYLPVGSPTPGNIVILLDDDEYFVLGDNRPVSSDSRSWGALKREYIIGKVFIRAFPFSSFSKIETPAFEF
ncbi:MAG: signal peptidase I [Patescibacteria group bacterium]